MKRKKIEKLTTSPASNFCFPRGIRARAWLIRRKNECSRPGRDPSTRRRLTSSRRLMVGEYASQAARQMDRKGGDASGWMWTEPVLRPSRDKQGSGRESSERWWDTRPDKTALCPRSKSWVGDCIAALTGEGVVDRRASYPGRLRSGSPFCASLFLAARRAGLFAHGLAEMSHIRGH